MSHFEMVALFFGGSNVAEQTGNRCNAINEMQITQV